MSVNGGKSSKLVVFVPGKEDRSSIARSMLSSNTYDHTYKSKPNEKRNQKLPCLINERVSRVFTRKAVLYLLNKSGVILLVMADHAEIRYIAISACTI